MLKVWCDISEYLNYSGISDAYKTNIDKKRISDLWSGIEK